MSRTTTEDVSWETKQVVLRPLEWLKPHPDNPRQITDDDVRALAQSIETLGFNDPIEAREDGEILCGHLRRLAALHLGLKRVPVLIHGAMSDAEATAYRIAHNKLGERVKWNRSLLADQLAGLPDIEASELGFEEKEVAMLFDIDRGFQEDDQQPEGSKSVQDEPGPFVRQGETWHFGDLMQLTVWGSKPESLRKVEGMIRKVERMAKVKATLGGPDGPTFADTIAERAVNAEPTL